MNSLQVVYDMSMNPASYDFLPFLAAAEKHRVAKGLAVIDVHFMPGESAKFYDRYFPKDESEREGLLWRVCVASCRLVSSVRNVYVHAVRSGVGGGAVYPESWANSRPDMTHGRAYLKGALRCFHASDMARKWVGGKYRNYMTITLRECAYGEDRNSDRVEWWKVAKAIRDMGGTVVVVPDTLGHGLKDFASCVEAAWDIDIRCALYEGALLNMGVENGPMTLAILSKSRFLMANTDLSLEDFTDGSTTRGHLPAAAIIPMVEPYWKAAA
jgi:hypothetical protein